MFRTYCKSKLYRIHVTGTELDYDGSLELDRDLMDAADIHPWEQVQVLNVNNGNRLITYVIPGERGTGTVSLKGPAARKAMVGDTIIVISYVIADSERWWGMSPKTVLTDENNKVTKIKE